MEDDKKMLTMVVITVLLLACIFVLITLKQQHNSHSDELYRTDVQPVLDRFPLLQKVNKVYWNAEIIGDTSFGPSSYRMKGYVFLDIRDAEKFLESFSWHDIADFKPTMKLGLNIHQKQEHEWVFSEEFNNYIKPSDFIGKFYFDKMNSLLYFEVEK
ncbi:hypothetical protein AB6A23_01155 [Paenibacillus tarimensis]